MTLAQFITKYEGKEWGYPTQDQYKGQCLSSVKWYMREVFGFNPPPSGVNAAYGYWTNFPNPLSDYFIKVTNTKEAIINPGDVPIWNSKVGGGYGHIAVCIQGGKDSFISLDQNWQGKAAHRVTHNFNNIYGWLRPKEIMSDAVQVDSKTFERLVTNSTRWDEVLKLGYSSAAQIEADVNNYKQEIKNLKVEIQAEKDKSASCRTEYVALMAKAAKSLGTVQEPVEVYNALDKLEADLDRLDDLERQFAALQLHSKEQVEELTAEINRLKLLKTSLDDATLEELIGAIIKKLTSILRKA